MTDNDAKTETLPLHTTIVAADEGDTGWMWWKGKWRLSTIIYDPNDDVLFAAAIINDECCLFDVEAWKHLPWLPIPRPPYEGNEMPCTHAVTIMDQQATLTFSWNANESDGKRMVQRITTAIDAMLRETDAPVSVG